MTPTPAQEWWTAEEIAASGLPDLPSTKRGVNQLIDRAGWRQSGARCRRRAGRGGGWEYSWTLFPVRAQRALLQRDAAPAAPVTPARDAAPAAPVTPARDAAWAWYDALPQPVKDRARARLQVIQQVEALEPALGRQGAVEAVARRGKVGARTVWAWFALIEGVRPDDRLPALAPRNRARDGKPRAKDCDPAFLDAVKAGWLRMGEPCFTDAWRDAVRLAQANGWDILSERTMRRRIDAAVSKPVQVLMRKGPEALRRMHPAQSRDKSAMRAMEAVNADFHKIDVFVAWPDSVPRRGVGAPTL